MEGPSPADRAPWTRSVWLTGGLVVVAAVAVVAWLAGRWTGESAAEPSPSASPSAQPTPLTATEVATLLAPSLVAVSVPQRARSDEPQGTGVVVADDATVLTALHVVSGADRIRLGFPDGTNTWAVVTGVDEDNDIATLVKNEDHELASAFLFLGKLHKVVGRDDLAIKYFKKVLKFDPKNHDAESEIRLANLREEKHKKKGIGGMLNRLTGGADES